jgi:ribulose-phosphate 3-epimerase
MPKTEKEKAFIYLGADHGGFHLKERIKKWLVEKGYRLEDLGNEKFDKGDDYPIFASLVARKVASEIKKGAFAKGILCCKSSAGMLIASNKIKGIRAFSPFNKETAILSREHNDANIIALSEEFIGAEEAKEILSAWLEAGFSEAPRHKRRISQIQRLEEKEIEVIPGILEKEFSQIEEKINKVSPFVKWVQIDFADGEFVKNRNFLEAEKFSQIKKDIFLEAHLMVKSPKDWLGPVIDGGFKRAIAHIEAEGVREFLEVAEKEGIEAGLAVDAGTNIEKILPFSDKIKTILIMGVKAGFSSQEFLPETFGKIIKAKEKLPSLRLAVDGGVNDLITPALVAAGADAVIVNSYLFSKEDIEKAIRGLQNF